MTASLAVWPLAFFTSIFLFDAPIRSAVDEVSRLGMAFTIWLYPLYLFPLIILWFRLSKRMGAAWLFCFCPVIPIAVFSFFMALGSSEYAESKPEGYDPSTYRRLSGAYAVDVNHVYFGNEILKGADPSSFRVLGERHAADSRHVWCAGDSIPGADPSTFVASDSCSSPDISLELTHDAHDYYCGSNPLNVADMGSFKRIGGSWAIDRWKVYYLGLVARIGKDTVAIGDYHTFRELNSFYAADDKYVYYMNEIVEGADPSTFAVLKEDLHYGQDKYRLYYHAHASALRSLDGIRHKGMERGLVETFHTDGRTVYNPELMAMPAGTDFNTIHRVERYRDWYVDKNRVYYENRLLPGASPKSFRIFPSHYVFADDVSNNNRSADYSQDGSRVYYRDSLLSGADAASFVCGYDFVESQPFAFDRYRYYQGRPNPALEALRQEKCRLISR